MQIADELACREFVELVTDYLEGVLPEELRMSLEAHLEVCSGCRLYLGQMRLTIHALHQRWDRSLSLETREKLLQHFRAWRHSRAEG